MTMMIKPDKNTVYVQNMLNAWPLDGTVTGVSSQKDMYGFSNPEWSFPKY